MLSIFKDRENKIEKVNERLRELFPRIRRRQSTFRNGMPPSLLKADGDKKRYRKLMRINRQDIEAILRTIFKENIIDSKDRREQLEGLLSDHKQRQFLLANHIVMDDIADMRFPCIEVAILQEYGQSVDKNAILSDILPGLDMDTIDGLPEKITSLFKCFQKIQEDLGRWGDLTSQEREEVAEALWAIASLTSQQQLLDNSCEKLPELVPYIGSAASDYDEVVYKNIAKSDKGKVKEVSWQEALDLLLNEVKSAKGV